MKTATMGLRERKRAQTRHRLEEAAVGLALREGLDKVTIDAISERADVSPRTFFNYFDSKEDAILGVRPPDVTEEVLAAHRARYDGAELIESLVGLLIAIMGPSIADSAFRETRMQVVRQNPRLLDGLMTRMAGTTEQLTAAVRQLAEQHGPAGTQVSDVLAETLLSTCAGGIRAATKQWTTTDLELSDSPWITADVEQRAVALVRQAIEKLT
jgi:AcrR family transcriptional regulator